MACFCRTTLPPLQRALQQAAPADAHPAEETEQASGLRALAVWLARGGLPAAPWQPDPAWLGLPLPPALPLRTQAMATLSGLAQLRADALALCGLDLLAPGQADGLLALVATVSARLPPAFPDGIDPHAWTHLAGALADATQVADAVRQGLLPAPPPALPPALPLEPWRPLLQALYPLLPLIAAATQLGLDLTEAFLAPLSARLRCLLAIRLPPLPPALAPLLASLTGTLAAIAQLRRGLGVDPLAAGLPAVRRMVAGRVAQAVQAVEQAAGVPLAALPGQLARPVFSPALIATPAVVQSAMRIDAAALAGLTWQVPPAASLPVLATGLPVLAFAAQLQAALGLPVALSTCAGGCDAAALAGGG